MSKFSKERILAVERILSTRPKTTNDIINCLQKRYAISCERKTIYDDIAVLTKYMNVQHCKEGWYIEKGDER